MGQPPPLPPKQGEELHHHQQQQNILLYHSPLLLFTCLHHQCLNCFTNILYVICIVNTTQYQSSIIMNQYFNFTHTNVKFDSSPPLFFAAIILPLF